MGCGCYEPTNINIANKKGQASNITVDVGNPDAWYTMILENRGTFSSSDDFVCNATIECGPSAARVSSTRTTRGSRTKSAPRSTSRAAPTTWRSRARVFASRWSVSRAPTSVYVDGPKDYEAETCPEEKRASC